MFKQPDELIKKLTELEHSASQDAGAREKIASLPTEIIDPSNLDKITGKLNLDYTKVWLIHKIVVARKAIFLRLTKKRNIVELGLGFSLTSN